MAEIPLAQHEQPVPFIDLVGQHNTIAPEVMRAVERVFATQQFVLGEEVDKLEQEIARYCHSR